MGLRRKRLQGEKVKLWDGFSRDASIISRSVLFVGGRGCPSLKASPENPQQEQLWKALRHYSVRLQLICQSCHIALHESLISPRRALWRYSAVLFLALHRPHHPGAVIDQQQQNKNSSPTLWTARVCGDGKKKKKRMRGKLKNALKEVSFWSCAMEIQGHCT